MRFRYLADPLFLFCLALYATNRWIIKPYFPNEFSQSYLNDLICIPFWIPIMVWLMKCSGVRKTDTSPTGGEIIIPLVLWSWLFEVYLPGLAAFKNLTFADPFDILCYTSGACLAAVFWRLWYGKPAQLVSLSEAASPLGWAGPRSAPKTARRG